MHIQEQQCLTFCLIVLQHAGNLPEEDILVQSRESLEYFKIRIIGKVFLHSCSDLQVPKMLLEYELCQCSYKC